MIYRDLPNHHTFVYGRKSYVKTDACPQLIMNPTRRSSVPL